MVNQRKGGIYFVFLGLAAAWSFSCTPIEDPVELKVQELLDQGKNLIAESANYEAVEKFEEILNEYDSDNPEAMWGIILSMSLESLYTLGDQVDEFVAIIAQTVEQFLRGSSASVAPQAYGLNMIIESMFNDIYLDAYEYMIPYMDKMKEYEDFVMQVDKSPVIVNIEGYFRYYMDIGGEYDYADAYFISGALKYLKCLSYLLYSINLSLSPTTLAAMVGFGQEILASQGVFEINRDSLLDLLAGLIHYSPDFLSLENSQGPERMAEAGVLLGEAIGDINRYLELASAERDEQFDDVLAYQIEGNREFLILNYKDENGNKLQLPVEFTDGVKRGLEQMRSSVESGGGVRVNWAGDIAPFLGFLAQGLIQSGVPDPIIEKLLEILEPRIGADVAASATELYGTLKGLATEGVLAGAISMVIPDVMDLDLGRLFNDPPAEYVRLLLPSTFIGPDGKPDVLLEYECPDTLRDSDFFCPYPEAISSTEHFVGTQYHIGDDEIANPLPYLSSPDPSLGGVLFFNLYSLNSVMFENQYINPGPFEFNYFIADAFGKLLAGALQSGDLEL